MGLLLVRNGNYDNCLFQLLDPGTPFGIYGVLCSLLVQDDV